MLYSYDIFDTCVSRLYAYPRDLYLDLGFHLAPSTLPSRRRLRMARGFQRRRILAEKVANLLSSPRRTASLDDIYAHFLLPSWLSSRRKEVMARELEWERAAIFKIPVMAAEVDALVADGARVIFVSDMYMEAAFLVDLLRDLRFLGADRPIYVSSEMSASKASGALYQVVLEAEGVQPKAMRHVGDNMESDVRAAKNLGIQARHFECSALTPHERRLAGPPRRRTPMQSCVAGLARKWRLTTGGTVVPMPVRDSIVYGTVVPFLLSYVSSVLRDAQRRGLRRLYFVARDGQVMHAIAQVLSPLYPCIELRYLYGSRRAWIPAALSVADERWRQLAYMRGEMNRASDLLERLGLGKDDIEAVRSVLGWSQAEWARNLSERQAVEFLDGLLGHREVAYRLHEQAARLRTIVGAYFRQEGLFDPVPWALVDVGWAFNCQAALRHILELEAGREIDVRGYYVGAARRSLPTEIVGDVHCFLRQSGSMLSRRRVVFEHVFTPATHPSTAGYSWSADAVLVPSLGPEVRSDVELDYAHRLNRIARMAAEDYMRDPGTRRVIDAGAAQVVRNAHRLLNYPTFDEAKAFEGFGSVSDARQDARFERPLCRSLTSRELLRQLASLLGGRPEVRGGPTWLEGSGALSPWMVRSTVPMLIALDKVLNGWRNLRVQLGRRHLRRAGQNEEVHQFEGDWL